MLIQLTCKTIGKQDFLGEFDALPRPELGILGQYYESLTLLNRKKYEL